MSEEQVDELLPEERLREFGDSLVASLFQPGQESKDQRRYMFSTVRPELFRNENYVLFRILYNLRDRGDVLPDEDFIGLYLTRNKKVLLEADGKTLELSAYGEVDDDFATGYSAGVLAHFRRIKALGPLSESEFPLVLEKYRMEFQAVEAENLLYKGLDTLSGGTEKKSGFEDASDLIRRGLGEIAGLVDSNKGSGFISLKDVFSSTSKIAEIYQVCDFGEIDELNEHYGGVYSSLLYTVLAPTKGGKSKFCARIVHNALVKESRNVTVWAPEGGPLMWGAQLRAIHFDHTYADPNSAQVVRFGVDQNAIMMNKYPSEEIKVQESMSWQDLQSNPAYGNIDFVDLEFNVETFIDNLDTSVKSNGSSLVVIDYMQLIGSSEGRLSKRERLSEAYPKLLDYAKKNNVAIISPAQYSQEAVKEMTRGADGDQRTSAGESAEIIRSSDVIFALWSTVEDQQNSRSTLLSMPSRLAAAHPPIDLYVNYESCGFYSVRGG